MIRSIYQRALISVVSTLVIAMLLATAISTDSHVGHAQGDTRTFPETGETVSGRFLAYWREHGGVAQQGLPISHEMQEISDIDGKTYTVQYFERAVFELHPENQPPDDVLLSLLGVFALREKYPQGAPLQTPQVRGGSRDFAETGKRVGGLFLEYWEKNGGLAQQGYPISEEFPEKSDLDGNTYTVQYFERAVFELHPENQPPYNVLLSQLGTLRYRSKYLQPPTPTFTPTPMPTATPLPPTATATVIPTPVPPNVCAGVPESIDMTVDPVCGYQGGVFRFYARGFEPGEPLIIYGYTPSGDLQRLERAPEQRAVGDGTYDELRLITYVTDELGIYTTIIEGYNSHHKAIGYLKLMPYLR